MRCPQCAFVASDTKDTCPRCNLDLRPHKERLGIKTSPTLTSRTSGAAKSGSPINTAAPAASQPAIKPPAPLEVRKPGAAAEPVPNPKPVEQAKSSAAGVACSEEQEDLQELVAALELLADGGEEPAEAPDDDFSELLSAIEAIAPEDAENRSPASLDAPASDEESISMAGLFIDEDRAAAPSRAQTDDDPLPGLGEEFFAPAAAAPAEDDSGPNPFSDLSFEKEEAASLRNASSVSAKLQEIKQSLPDVSPPVLEFGDTDDDLFDQKLDEMIGGLVLDIQAVKQDAPKPSKPADKNINMFVDDDLEISFEIDVADNEEREPHLAEHRESAPAEASQEDPLEVEQCENDEEMLFGEAVASAELEDSIPAETTSAASTAQDFAAGRDQELRAGAVEAAAQVLQCEAQSNTGTVNLNQFAQLAPEEEALLSSLLQSAEDYDRAGETPQPGYARGQENPARGAPAANEVASREAAPAQSSALEEVLIGWLEQHPVSENNLQGLLGLLVQRNLIPESVCMRAASLGRPQDSNGAQEQEPVESSHIGIPQFAAAADADDLPELEAEVFDERALFDDERSEAQESAGAPCNVPEQADSICGIVVETEPAQPAAADAGHAAAGSEPEAVEAEPAQTPDKSANPPEPIMFETAELAAALAAALSPEQVDAAAAQCGDGEDAEQAVSADLCLDAPVVEYAPGSEVRTGGELQLADNDSPEAQQDAAEAESGAEAAAGPQSRQDLAFAFEQAEADVEASTGLCEDAAACTQSNQSPDELPELDVLLIEEELRQALNALCPEEAAPEHSLAEANEEPELLLPPAVSDLEHEAAPAQAAGGGEEDTGYLAQELLEDELYIDEDLLASLEKDEAFVDEQQETACALEQDGTLALGTKLLKTLGVEDDCAAEAASEPCAFLPAHTGETTGGEEETPGEPENVEACSGANGSVEIPLNGALDHFSAALAGPLVEQAPLPERQNADDSGCAESWPASAAEGCAAHESEAVESDEIDLKDLLAAFSKESGFAASPPRAREFEPAARRSAFRPKAQNIASEHAVVSSAPLGDIPQALWAETLEEVSAFAHAAGAEMELGLNEICGFKQSDKQLLLFDLTAEELAAPGKRRFTAAGIPRSEERRVDNVELAAAVKRYSAEATLREEQQLHGSTAPADPLGTLDFAGWWRQCLASAIDGVIAVGVGLALYWLGWLPEAAKESLAIADFAGLWPEGLPHLIRGLLSCYAVWVCLPALCIAVTGQTPGGRMLGITVVDARGASASAVQALTRAAGRALTVLTLGLGLLPLLSKKKQTLHDMLAGTYVVNAGTD